MNLWSASLVAAEGGSGDGGTLGLIPLIVIAVLGYLVWRLLQRQREYERRVGEHPDGHVHRQAPDEPEGPPAPDDPGASRE